MPWLDLRAEIALEFQGLQPDIDLATEEFAAFAREAQKERAARYYEKMKYDPKWIAKHRRQALLDYHLSGYGRRHRRKEESVLRSGQQRLFDEDTCESRAANTHVKQFHAAAAGGTDGVSQKHTMRWHQPGLFDDE